MGVVEGVSVVVARTAVGWAGGTKSRVAKGGIGAALDWGIAE